MKRSARHCTGGRFVTGSDGVTRQEPINGGKCRSHEGLCGCDCKGCKAAATCKHENTYASMGTLTPMFPDQRWDFGHGRAKREDGTDYVGPTVTVRPRRPDEPVPKVTHSYRETCLDCGLAVKHSEREEG